MSGMSEVQPRVEAPSGTPGNSEELLATIFTEISAEEKGCSIRRSGNVLVPNLDYNGYASHYMMKAPLTT